MMTLHPCEDRAGDTCGHLEADAQHQQLAAMTSRYANLDHSTLQNALAVLNRK